MAQRNLTLLTDLYELTMMQGCFKEGDANETVISGAFYHGNSNNNGYSICAGLEQVIKYVKNPHFDKEDMDYLRTAELFKEDSLNYLHHFRFTGGIYAIPGGTVVFLRESLVKVIAPIMEAQLAKTAILDIINHQSSIATKTTRVIYTTQEDGAMEFGLRRAQGPDAGTYRARTTMIAGCIDTFNMLTGQMFDVPIKGTHAHSWVMSFPNELAAFCTYTKLYLPACIPLTDAYDMLKSGVPNAIKVFNETRGAGIPLTFYGIRLDSGDLAYLSEKAGKMLDAAGLLDAVISASNDSDENLISSLKLQGATINPRGIDTSLITSKDCLSFGGMYKLAAVKDKKTGEFTLKTRLSKNAEEITNPGNKMIQWIYNKETGRITADLICLVGETYNSKDPPLLFSPTETWKKVHLAPDSYTLRELMVPVFRNGVCICESPRVVGLQAYCRNELATLWEESPRLEYPYRTHVNLSQLLWNTKSQLLDSHYFQG